jgi:hypothetical protein
MRVFAPYCAEHAKQGWFTDDPVSADEITSRGITLSGVADAFVLALLDLRRGPSLSHSRGRNRP